MGKAKNLRHVARDATLGLLSLLAGAVIFMAASALFGSTGDHDAEASLSVDLTPPPVGPGAESPEAAIAAFLNAEMANDVGVAYVLLSSEDRASYPAANIWAARRSSILGSIVSWEWQDDTHETTRVELVPNLSVTTGWTPSSRSIEWGLVDQDGWRIALQSSDSIPFVPPEGAALDAAVSWLSDEGRCATNDFNLRPTSAVYQRLCDVGGVAESDGSDPVSGALAAELSNAYGSDVSSWARTVGVEGGIDLVIAAIGDQWVVIDAVERV